MITISAYEDQYQPDFRRLNMEWLEKYALTEPHDLEVLDDPRGAVLNKGGFIFLAFDGPKVIGTAGLYREPDNSFELVKMTVDPGYRGRGISKLLLDRCISAARDAGAGLVFLFSSSKLSTALQLYEKYGFRHVPVENSPFETADVKMELSLAPHPQA